MHWPTHLFPPHCQPSRSALGQARSYVKDSQLRRHQRSHDIWVQRGSAQRAVRSGGCRGAEYSELGSIVHGRARVCVCVCVCVRVRVCVCVCTCVWVYILSYTCTLRVYASAISSHTDANFHVADDRNVRVGRAISPHAQRRRGTPWDSNTESSRHHRDCYKTVC
jgi:hypothetical protein